MIKLGILGSTKGTDLQAILDGIDSGELNAQVSIVVSNRENAFILKRAKANNIPFSFISHKGKSRTEFDSQMTEIFKKKQVDLILLIGFMRILSSEFCNVWHDKILNVHPSLLPKYAGGMDINVHAEVIKNKEKETGCTIHFVTDQVDGGPILIQKRCLVDPVDTPKTLKNKVQKLEGEAFLEAVNLIKKEYHTNNG